MEIFDGNVKLRTAELSPDVIPTPTKAMKMYLKLYMCADRSTPEPVEKTVDRMKEHGITKCIVRGEGPEHNKLVADLCKKYPGFFYGFAGINASLGATKGYDALKKAYEEYGMLGVSIGPMFSGMKADDRRNYPLFALTDSMGKVLVSHTALHYNPDIPYEVADPKYLDRVAVDFPNMKIILGHAGQGFSTQGLSVCHRHRNVFLDFSALAPEILSPEFVFSANTFLRKKVIFGTSYPLLDFDVVDRWKGLISESNHQLFFHDNLAKLMGLL